MLRNYCYNLFALQWGGPAGIVAWSTVNTLSGFLSSLPKAVGQATLMGSGVFYGEEDKDSLMRFMRCTFLRRSISTLIMAGVVFAASPLLIGLYLPVSSEAFADAVSGLRWYALGLLPYTANVILASYLQSVKKTTASTIIQFMDGFGMLVIFAFFLLHVFGFRGLCVSFFVGKSAVTLAALICILAFRRPSRTLMENLLLLPEDFDVPDEDKFLATLVCPEDAVNISEKVIVYCAERGIDPRRCHHVGLAVEEMAVIIIDNGFGDGKVHSIDIKLFVKNDQITLRMRDDCRAFDVNQRIAIMKPENSYSHIGIRILRSIALDMDYYSTLDMNCLTMHI